MAARTEIILTIACDDQMWRRGATFPTTQWKDMLYDGTLVQDGCRVWVDGAFGVVSGRQILFENGRRCEAISTYKSARAPLPRVKLVWYDNNTRPGV